MAIEVVPTNQFTVEFNEDKKLVEIRYQGLQASLLAALTYRVDELEDDLAEAILGSGGGGGNSYFPGGWM